MEVTACINQYTTASVGLFFFECIFEIRCHCSYGYHCHAIKKEQPTQQIKIAVTKCLLGHCNGVAVFLVALISPTDISNEDVAFLHSNCSVFQNTYPQ